MVGSFPVRHQCHTMPSSVQCPTLKVLRGRLLNDCPGQMSLCVRVLRSSTWLACLLAHIKCLGNRRVTTEEADGGHGGHGHPSNQGPSTVATAKASVAPTVLGNQHGEQPRDRCSHTGRWSIKNSCPGSGRLRPPSWASRRHLPANSLWLRQAYPDRWKRRAREPRAEPSPQMGASIWPGLRGRPSRVPPRASGAQSRQSTLSGQGSQQSGVRHGGQISSTIGPGWDGLGGK